LHRFLIKFNLTPIGAGKKAKHIAIIILWREGRKMIEPEYILTVAIAGKLTFRVFKDIDVIQDNKFPIVFIIGTFFMLISLAYNHLAGNITMENLESFFMIKFINFGLTVLFNEMIMKALPNIFQAVINKIKDIIK
jgi:hypothetical protein